MKRKLRTWVKVVLSILLIVSIVNFIKWDKEQYDNCMNYTNNNKVVCDDIKK